MPLAKTLESSDTPKSRYADPMSLWLVRPGRVEPAEHSTRSIRTVETMEETQTLGLGPAGSPAMPPSPRLLDGRYLLAEPLAEGALGVVFRALHRDIGRWFAVKLLKPAALGKPLHLARFRREATALGRLRHPAIVEITDFGIAPADLEHSEEQPYLVMELVEGPTLADLCRRGPLPAARALPLLDSIAAAVDAAHAQGILHRDLKPANVLLPDAGNSSVPVKVVDFGLAAILGSAERSGPPPLASMAGADFSTATGILLGTPLYAAPEVIRGRPAGPAADLYSLAVIAYEMLAGRPPFWGTTAQVLTAHLQREPAAPPGLPREIAQVLVLALAKEPADRPSSGAELVRRLRRAAERAALARWRREETPRRLRWAAAAAVVALAAGLLLPASAAAPVERRAFDLRLRAAPLRPPDPRIVLVSFDEASLREGPPLADRAAEVADRVSRLFAAGARGVALDLLLPAQWNRSPAFSDLLLRHSRSLTLAAFSAPDGSVLGTDCAGGLTAVALGPPRTADLFGLVNLDEDRDAVTRHGRRVWPGRGSGGTLSWAARAAGSLVVSPAKAAGGRFWIDHRIDWPRYARLSWREVPALLARHPEAFRGRLVLVGGDFLGAGDDDHPVPWRPGRPEVVSGLTLQAMQVDTLMAGLPLREADGAPVAVVAALLAGLAAVGILLAPRAAVTATAAAVVPTLLLVYLAASLPFFRATGLLLPVASPGSAALAGLLAALALRRALPRPPGRTRL
jgi:CHASE2 domain-containing sensor protein/tRNA A-37 threonylcarbamoyl transferase component Bud32